MALCGIFSGFRSGFTNFATSSSASDASDDALPLSHVRYAKPPSITSEVKLGVRDIDRGSGESGGTAVVVVVVVVAVAAAAFLRFVRPGRGFAAPSASAIVGASRDVAGARDPGVTPKRRPVRNVSHFASIRFFSYSYSTVWLFSMNQLAQLVYHCLQICFRQKVELFSSVSRKRDGSPDRDLTAT